MAKDPVQEMLDLEEKLASKRKEAVNDLKAQHREKLTELRGIEKQLESLGSPIRGGSAPSSPELSGKKVRAGSWNEQIIPILEKADGPMSPKEITKILEKDWKPSGTTPLNLTVSQALNNGVKSGLYEKQGRGQYVLA